MQGVKWDNPERKNYYTSRLSYSYEVLIARKFSNAISLQLMPSLVHRNFVATNQDPNDVYSIGVGGRVKLTNRTSLNVEYYYQLPNTKPTGSFNSLALGFDIETVAIYFNYRLRIQKE